MIKIITILFCMFISGVFAQVGIGTDTPNSDSALDISSSTKGVLISRVSLVETIDPAPLSNHVAGMIVYNTTQSGTGDTTVFPGFYYNDGTKWIRLEPISTTIGDIKHSLLTTDHNGWYKLDGRNTSTLPAMAQQNATSIGFGATIPDAADKFLKGKSASESLMTVGGNNSVVLAQSNLPNLTFTGTVASSGAHTHDYTDRYHGVPEDLNIVTGLLGILSGVVLSILNNDVGSDVVSTATSTSTASGAHTHTGTISTGGSNLPLEKTAHLITNTFVYLGS